MQQTNSVKEGEVFFRQWLRSPKSMGSVIPSSRSLALCLADAVTWRPGCKVVELGGGTGAITEGLIARGIPRSDIVVIELEDDLFRYLEGRLPGSKVIQGDATKLNSILAEHGIENVSTVVSGLPMVGMPFAFQEAIVNESFAALKRRGSIIQYSYSPLSPIPARKLGVRATMAGFTLRNVPPAFVWRFSPVD